MKTYLTLAVLSLAINLSLPVQAGPTSFKTEPKQNNYAPSYNTHYKSDRYQYDDGRYHRAKKKYRHHRKHRRTEPDFIYVLPKGSKIVIINGTEYYQWQKRHYLSGYYKGDKIFIAVDL